MHWRISRRANVAATRSTTGANVCADMSIVACQHTHHYQVVLECVYTQTCNIVRAYLIEERANP